MKPTHQIAYDYAMANIQQSAAIDQVNTALRSLGSDNYMFSLCEPLEAAYTKLVEELLGPELWDWLMCGCMKPTTEPNKWSFQSTE